MDLSFTRAFATRVPALPQGLAVMLAGAAARQAASPAACVAHGQLPLTAFDVLFAPESGAFNAAAAASLMRWKG